MKITSIIRQLLRDDESLNNYLLGNIPTTNDLKRRLFLKEREEDTTIPDHHYRLLQLSSFNKIEYIGDITRLGLYRLSYDHLFLRNKKIYVLQERQNDWQQLITSIPPLVLQAAYLHIHAPVTGHSSHEITEFYGDWIFPNTKFTALPHPYIPQLEQYITEKKGLHDLHMHLNGATETDIAWQDFLRAPDKIYKELEIGFRSEKVREQLEQESHLFSPTSFNNLLRIAQRIREVLYAFLIEKDEKPFKGKDEKQLLHLILDVEDQQEIYGTYLHPFRQLISSDQNYPHLMSVECLMYIFVFRHMAHAPESPVVWIFHFYLLILGLTNRLLVQQRHQYGFEQFQKHTLNGLREHSELEYRNRFLQMQGNELRHLKFLEGRFSPKPTQLENIDFIRKIECGWKQLLETKEKLYEKNETDTSDAPILSLIAHFIKKPDKNDPYIRHKFLRKEVWEKAKVLSLLIKNYPGYQDKIVGIDAAASEFDTPPEVFAPAFRMLRRHGFNHFTYHAGEDFYHIISGLRAVYEAVMYNDLQYGDRIGHATATALSSENWINIMGKDMLIKRGEWLDNLIFAYHLIICHNIESLKKHIPIIINDIQKYAVEVYKKYYSIKMLEDGWLFRKYCPIILLNNDLTIDDEEYSTIKNLKIEECHKIIFSYHDIHCRKFYDEIIPIKTSEIFNAAEIEILQKETLAYLHKKEIIIETLPTSNVRIGHHTNYDTYHLWNWIKWEESGHCIPPIVVGTDDTGIFATNIYNEYANIYCHLTSAGKASHTQAMSIIERLDKNASIYKFYREKNP